MTHHALGRASKETCFLRVARTHDDNIDLFGFGRLDDFMGGFATADQDVNTPTVDGFRSCLVPELVYTAFDAFFDALARVQEIHSNCRRLLRTHHQRAGLELMDVMAGYQETAHERLCRWVQAECRALAEEDGEDAPELLSRAMAALRARPALARGDPRRERAGHGEPCLPGHTQVTAQANLQRMAWWHFRAFLRC